MSKKIRIEDTPEFKYFEEHQDEILKELEEDENVKDLEIPEEWDIAFRQTIQDTFEEKKRRKRKRIRTILVTAASFVVVAGFSVNYTLERVQGVGIIQLVQSLSSDGGNNYTVYSSDVERYDMVPEDNSEVVYFEGETLSFVLGEFREEIKAPMFYLDDILEEFKVKEAKYNKTFHILNIEMVHDDQYLYISQERKGDEGVSGVITDSDELAFVKNEHLGMEIPIYKSMQPDYLTFNVHYNNSIVTLTGKVTLDECKSLAENLRFE